MARKHLPEWLAAIRLARGLPENALPDTGGNAVAGGPPPTHRWAERDPAAAARLAAVRAAIAELAERHTMPTENLLPRTQCAGSAGSRRTRRTRRRSRRR